MMILVTFLALLVTDPSQIARVNKLKSEAEKAFLAKDFKTASQKYGYLADTLGAEEAEIRLNLAHSQFHLGDTANAKINYQSAGNSETVSVKSAAYQQLGVLAKNGGNLDESLQYLKSAIKTDPTNDGARYDYEVVKKLLNQQKENQQKQDQNKENQDQEKQDQQKQDQQDQQKQDQENKEKSEQQKEEQKEGEKKEGEEEKSEEEKKQEEAQKSEEQKQENVRQKLEEMNISEEKAKMILEALKNNEIQYIQQRKRKATEQPDSGKPDW